MPPRKRLTSQEKSLSALLHIVEKELESYADVSPNAKKTMRVKHSKRELEVSPTILSGFKPTKPPAYHPQS